MYIVYVLGAQAVEVTLASEALALARAVKGARVSSDINGERRVVYSEATEKALAAGRRVGLIQLADEELAAS